MIINKLSFSSDVESIKQSELLWKVISELNQEDEEKALAYVRFVNGEGLLKGELNDALEKEVAGIVAVDNDKIVSKKTKKLVRMLFTYYCAPRYKNGITYDDGSFMNMSLFTFMRAHPEYIEITQNELYELLENSGLLITVQKNKSDKSEIIDDTLYLAKSISLKTFHILNRNVIYFLQKILMDYRNGINENSNCVLDVYASELRNCLKKSTQKQIKNTQLYSRLRLWRFLQEFDLTIADFLEFFEVKLIDFEECYKQTNTIFCIVQDSVFIFDSTPMDVQTFQYYLSLQDNLSNEITFDSEIFEAFNKRFEKTQSSQIRSINDSKKINKVGAFK